MARPYYVNMQDHDQPLPAQQREHAHLSKHRLSLSISQPAYNALNRMAANATYKWPDSKTAKGLSAYIRAVFAKPTQQWLDCRPAWMIEESERRLDPQYDKARKRAFRHDTPHVPMWWDPDTISADNPRIQRLFYAEDLPIPAIRAVALPLGIGDPQAHELRSSDGSIVGSFLETWGQGHIRPTEEPHNQRAPQYRWRPAPRELVW